MSAVKMPEAVAFASSDPMRKNQLCSRAQYDSALPKNRTKFDIPLISMDQAEAYAMAKVQEAAGWVRVEDGLPQVKPGDFDGARVLAFWATTDPDEDPGGIETSWFDGRNWQGANGEMDYHGNRRVTHWMPLPATPDAPQTQESNDDHYARLELEHLGDPVRKTGIYTVRDQGRTEQEKRIGDENSG